MRIYVTGDEMVRAEDVISICQRLLADGIQVWLTGGWGDPLERPLELVKQDLKYWRDDYV